MSPEPAEEELRALGLWWLPGRADHKVAGVLRFNPDGGGGLELIGSLGRVFDASEEDGDGSHRVTASSLERASNYGRIVGLADAKSFTLEGCFRTHGSLLASEPGHTTERVHVNQVIRGAEFEADEALDATGVAFCLLHMPYFIDQGGVEEAHYFADKVPEGELLVTINITRTPDLTVALSDGSSLSISETVRLTGDRIASRGLVRDFNVMLSGQRQEIMSYVEAASDIQDLVSIGIGKTASFEHLSFFHPDIQWERGDDLLPIPIEFHAQWATRETRNSEPPKPHKIPFTLQDLGGGAFLSRWCDVARKHRSSLGRVMGTRYRSHSFASEQLLNRAAALESFDRRRLGYEGSRFRTRMSRSAALAGECFAELVGDVDRWTEVFKRQRDAIAHHVDRQPGEVAEIDLYLADAAYYLFIACMLREAEAPEAVFEKIAGTDNFRFTRGRLRPLLDL